jgi:hypothetical protein
MGIARTVALILGVVYVLVGVLGFIPGITAQGGDFADMPSASGAILGIFPVNVLHNVVHLAIGAALLYGSTSTPLAIVVSRVIGVVYLLVGVIGFFSADTFGLMPIGGADILLHLASAAVLLYIGFMAPGAEARTV